MQDELVMSSEVLPKWVKSSTMYLMPGQNVITMYLRILLAFADPNYKDKRKLIGCSCINHTLRAEWQEIAADPK